MAEQAAATTEVAALVAASTGTAAAYAQANSALYAVSTETARALLAEGLLIPASSTIAYASHAGLLDGNLPICQRSFRPAAALFDDLELDQRICVLRDYGLYANRDGVHIRLRHASAAFYRSVFRRYLHRVWPMIPCESDGDCKECPLAQMGCKGIDYDSQI
jgi:hypothetical protein